MFFISKHLIQLKSGYTRTLHIIFSFYHPLLKRSLQISDLNNFKRWVKYLSLFFLCIHKLQYQEYNINDFMISKFVK